MQIMCGSGMSIGCSATNLETMLLRCEQILSEQCDFIAKQETDALKRYRKLDREGHVVNDLGDDRCMNRAPGGESHGHGYSPHFCCCVFGQRSKFKKRK